MEYMEELAIKYPERGTLSDFEAELDKLLSDRKRGLPNGAVLSYPVTLNVVIHIVNQGEPLGVGSNIDDMKIVSQFSQTNEDFTNRNGTDTGIRFHLYGKLNPLCM